MFPPENLLRPGYRELTAGRRKTANGFHVVTAPDGTLRHFAFYREGEPRGWCIDETRATRTQIREGGSEEWLRDMIDTIYRDAEAEHAVCAFCGKSSAEVATLIAGPDSYTYICDECVDVCGRILSEKREQA